MPGPATLRTLLRRLLLAAALTGSTGAGAAAAQQLPAGYEEGLFELRVVSLDPQVVTALVDPRGALLLPATQLLDLVGLPYRLDPDVRRLALPSGADSLVVELGARLVTRGATQRSLAPGEAVWAAEQLFLAVPLLRDALGARVEVDWSTLAVTLSREPAFPAQARRIVAERRTAQQARAQQTASTPLGEVAFRPRTGVGVLEWDLSMAGRAPEQAQLGLRAGAGVLGGELVAQGDLAREGVRRGDLRYRRVFPHSSLVRQLELGQVAMGGVRTREVRGVLLTNAPLHRSTLFDQVLVRPEVPAGWEYEVYQDGRLVGFSDAGARAPVSVTRQYGNTPVEVRMYGPGGEQVVSNYFYQIAPSQLPAGRVEYSLGAGRCAFGACDAFSVLSLQYGATGWLTVGGGGEYVRDDSARAELLPFASAVLAPRGGWLAELQSARDAVTRARLQYRGPTGTTALLAGALERPGYGQPSFIPRPAGRWQVESGVGGRLPALPLQSLRVDARVEGERGGALDRWRVTASTALRAGYLEVSRERNPYQPAELTGLSATVLAPGGAPRWIRQRPITVGVQMEGVRPRLGELATAIQPRPNGYLSAALRWDRRVGPMLSLGYTARMGFGRFQAHGIATSGAAPTLTTALGGTLAFSPGSGVTALPGSGIGAAGVSGHVFFDLDADGRFGPGDRPAADVETFVGGMRVRTGPSGAFRSWSVMPYEVVPVRVDTLGALGGGWTPLDATVLLRPAPHVFNRVSIPLVRTRELAGRLVAAPGVRTVAGVTLEIRRRGTDEVHRVSTFSDGEFYVSRLRPGAYELVVLPSSLRALRARTGTEVIPFQIDGEGEDVLVELEPIVLHPAPPN